jgi:hypothetical protein
MKKKALLIVFAIAACIAVFINAKPITAVAD